MTYKEKLQKDLILLDGGFGTYIQRCGLEDKHFKDRPGCMEYLSVVSPELVAKVHRDYLAVGSDAVETNTFGGNALKLAEYGLEDKVYEINLASTRIAKEEADKASSPDHPRFVVGSMGPTGKLPSSTDPELGNVSYSELKSLFFDQALGMIDGGADALLVETSQDLLEMKAAINGAREAINDRQKDLVLMAQCTLANAGRMLLGTDIFGVISLLSYLDVDVIGLNCSTGPIEMEGAIKVLSERSPKYISVVPNAGLPVEVDGQTIYPMKPDEMAAIMARLVEECGINIIGGCCGTGPEHIKALRQRINAPGKRKVPKPEYYTSFYKGVSLSDVRKPIKMGERINTHGSKKLRELLINEDFDGVIDIGREQEAAGADILDVCTVLTERNTEERDSVKIIRDLAESVDIPLMVDTTDVNVMRAALENYPGTMFINSVNLESGDAKADQVFALAKEHGAFVINLVIDEKGMADTLERKLEVAGRLYKKATEEFGIEGHRLLFDMLTFTLGTGEEEYAASAVTTCKAIREFKKACPDALTVLGVSNVSFGLKKEARKVLNMAFLHYAVRSGLDAAIVNPAEYIEYEDIPSVERKLADDLVMNKHKDALVRFVDHFEGISGKKKEEDIPEKDLTPEDRLRKCIFDRDKTGIIKAVEDALNSYEADKIINDILMNAMREVGDKLDSGEMVLPYVLQSAEVMRKAIEYLGQFLPKESAGARGKVVLATVFGDVHDIGKNLVKMILKNNGFEVIDLGKQVPVEKIIEEAKRVDADAVGLSALLVSTSRHMKTCVQSLHDAGLSYPVLIGGAPVNNNFARDISILKDESVYKGGVFYSKDAFTGLKIMQLLTDPGKNKSVMEEYHDQFVPEDESEEAKAKAETVSFEDNKVSLKGHTVKAPFLGTRPLTNISADDVFGYIDEEMLFNVFWGARLKDPKEKNRIVEEEYRPLLEELKGECIRKNWLDLRAVYGYFKCRAHGENMELLDDNGEVVEKFHFSRSKDEKALSLADYFSNENDIVAFQAVTVGAKINDAVKSLVEDKEETRAFFLHGLSVYVAEALAAYVHDIIRKELGIKDEQGKRYSPGYPLWRDIKDQKKLFRILEAEKYTGMTLTEEFQIIPEQSTTAMIVYNDKAEY